MYRLALVALVACGDGRQVVGVDAQPTDASARGIVRVKVTGFVEKGGLAVYFQDSDSTLALATRTDAGGEAIGRVGPDGFVTLVAGEEPALTLWTYSGVQPGDELEFYEPPLVGAAANAPYISTYAPGSGDPPFALISSCATNSQLTVNDSLEGDGVALPLIDCAPRIDFLLERGGEYRYVRDADLSTRELHFNGPFLYGGTSTLRFTNAPTFSASQSQSLVGHLVPMATSATIGVADDDDVVTTVHELPMPAGATLLTEIDPDDVGVQHIIDWRPMTAFIEIAYDEVTVAGASVAPRYDATRTSIVWTDAAEGTRGNLARATLHFESDEAALRTWVVIGPRGDEAALRVPLLPVASFVPHVEVPQTMETFLLDDDLGWVRTHLHGRWLPLGVPWPAHGERGRVTWRSL